MAEKFECSTCGGDRFYTIESLRGTCDLLDGAKPGDYEFCGFTVVDWNISKTIGYGCCNCGEERRHFIDLGKYINTDNEEEEED